MTRLPRLRLAVALAATLVATSVACSRSSVADGNDTLQPQPIGESECASCGMIVGRQPSPRGQVAHRDGTHSFFCSVADMIVYLSAPSPHGEVLGSWVEAMPVDVDPASESTEDRPWTDAQSAFFVLGDFHRRVMGRPVLAFTTEPDATAVATRLEAEVVTWSELPPLVE